VRKSNAKKETESIHGVGYSRCAGPADGACLIISKNAKEARKAAYDVLSEWFDQTWIDTTVQWIRKPNQQARTLLERGRPVVVESPDTCKACEKWGGELYGEDGCSFCNGDRRDGCCQAETTYQRQIG